MIHSGKADILSHEDVKSIVDSFYKKVRNSPLIGHYFKHVDWEKHLPVMYSFWSFIVLGEEGYKGNPLSKHLQLEGLKEEHFKEWLTLFLKTIEDNFQGENAEAMKNRANQIALVFQMKLVKSRIREG